jgi:GTP-binding protein
MAFRREKHVPKGGPSGGDGGPGGDVVFLADPDLRDLHALRFSPHVRAGDGRHGEGANRTGAAGEEAVVRVPVGTQVLGADGTLVCDLAHAGARVVIARGGRGGAGNRHFTTATRQAPRVAGVGADGGERTLDLHLKLMADAALLGFPNVGKSSLLAAISNAKPKIADYPFTTIEPQLGTVDADDGHQLTVVDVPGLLEGASAGIGMGHDFLAHLERARLLLHVVDASQAAADLKTARAAFAVIYGELHAHGHGLAERPRIVVLNKLDLLAPEAREAVVQEFADAIAAGGDEADRTVARDDDDRPVVVGTSCATGEGIRRLQAALFRHVPRLPAEALPPAELADFLVYRPGRREGLPYRLLREEGGFRVVSADLERVVSQLDPDRPDDLARIEQALDDLGVLGALRRAGARDGDAVTIGDRRLVYVPDPVRS